MDTIIFFIVIFNIILDLVNFCQSAVDHMSVFHYYNGDSVLQMSHNTGTGSSLPGNSGIPNSGGNPGGQPGNTEGFGGYNTNRQIINDDGNWSNTIRNLFIYGTGGLRFLLTRNGPPSQRIFIIGGTLVVDSLGRIVQNLINDPNYVLAQSTAWRMV